MDNIESIQNDISDIEVDIESRKQSKAESAGAIKTYMKQLKETYDLKSYDEISSFISDGLKEVEKVKGEILKLYGRILDEYNKASNRD